MAIFHVHLKGDRRPSGERISSKEHAEYVNREGKYKEKDLSLTIAGGWEREAFKDGNIAFQAGKGQTVLGTAKGFVLPDDATDDEIAFALALASSRAEGKIKLTGFKDMKDRCKRIAQEGEINDRSTDRKANHRKNTRVPKPDFNSSIRTPLKSITAVRDVPRLCDLPRSSVDGVRRANVDVLLQGDEQEQLVNARPATDADVRWSIPRRRAREIAQRELQSAAREKEKLQASSHADYVTRKGAFSRRGDCAYKESRLPKWAHGNPSFFFAMADKFTNKKARRYNEVEFALPNELSLEENIGIVKDFIKVELPHNYFTFAIHDKEGAISGERHLHCHLMLSPRIIDEVEKKQERRASAFFRYPMRKTAKDYRDENARRKRGAPIDPHWSDIKQPQRIRELLERLMNEALARNGFTERVSRLSLKAQREEALKEGDTLKAELLNRAPEKPLGVAAYTNDPKAQELKKARLAEKIRQEALLEAEAKKAETNDFIRREQETVLLEEAAEIRRMQDFQNITDEEQILAPMRDGFLNLLKAYEETRTKTLTNAQAYDRAQLSVLRKEERQTLMTWRRAGEALSRYLEWQTQEMGAMNSDGGKTAKLEALLENLYPHVLAIKEKLATPYRRKLARQKALKLMRDDKKTRAQLVHLTSDLDTIMKNLEDALQAKSIQWMKEEGCTSVEILNGLRAEKSAAKSRVFVLYKKMMAAKKEVISPERAKSMARDVLTGAKMMRQSRRKLEKAKAFLIKDKEDFTARLHALRITPPPVEAREEMRASLLAEREALKSREAELQALSMNLAQQEAAAANLLMQPDVQAKVDQIATGILRKNETAQTRFSSLQRALQGAQEAYRICSQRLAKAEQDLKPPSRAKSRYRLLAPSPSGLSPLHTLVNALGGNEICARLVAKSADDDSARKTWVLLTEAEKEEKKQKALGNYL